MPKLNIKEAEVMDLYITRLVADKGLREEDRAQHGKISHQLQLEFEEACQKALINALPDDKAIELNKKLTADPNFSDAEIEKFFAAALPNSEQVIVDTMTKFRADYLGETAKSTATATKSQPENTESAPAAQPIAAKHEGNVQAASAAPTTPTTDAATVANVQPNGTAAAPTVNVPGAAATPNMTQTQGNTAMVPPAGNPAQGTTSKQPGASNVEGAANVAPAAQPATAQPQPEASLGTATAPENLAAQPTTTASQNPAITTEEKM